MILRAESVQDLSAIAAKIIEKNKDIKVFAVYGEMGAGKTTLIKEFCKYLGVEGITNSPTFSIINEYYTKSNGVIYHFDFYRIEKDEDLYNIGIEEYFNQDAWCFVEWPDIAEEELTHPRVDVKIKVNNSVREFLITPSVLK